jgi:perosamine synthetase
MSAGERPTYDPLASAGGGATLPEPRIRMAAPMMGDQEVDAVREVLESGFLTNGPWTRRFEERMAERHGTAHGVAFANGTVALAAMYLAAGIGPGDEVIVPSFTFFSTCTSVLHVGATPVFADIEPDTFNLDPADVARRITPRTKAIVPVHYAGQPAQMDAFAELGRAHGIRIFEDAAEAHGASFGGRPAGSLGDAAMFSFTPTKNITTGEGSVVTTDDDELAQQMRLLRNHGMTRQYHHEILGWNWRLSDILSAVGCCQMDRLDDIIATKRANAAHLGQILADIPGVVPPAAPSDREHVYMIYPLLVDLDRRPAVTAALDAAGIEWRVYFPPAHLQPVFAGAEVPSLPVTEDVASRIVCIPFHAKLTRAELDEIAATLRAATP